MSLHPSNFLMKGYALFFIDVLFYYCFFSFPVFSIVQVLAVNNILNFQCGIALCSLPLLR